MSEKSPIYYARLGKESGDLQPLYIHLLNVSLLAGLFASRIGLKILGDLIGLIHDLGKYGEEFQYHFHTVINSINLLDPQFIIPRKYNSRIDHSTAGAQRIWEILSKKGDIGRIAGQILASCIASHHSGLMDCLSNDSCQRTFTGRMKNPEERTHLNEVIEKMDPSISKYFHELINHPDLIENLKKVFVKVMLSDRVKGLDPHKNQITQFKIGLLVRFLSSCLTDADRIDAADFENPETTKSSFRGQRTEWSPLLSLIEKYRSHGNEIQNTLSSRYRNSAMREKNIFLLTVPTENGRILGSIYFALMHAYFNGMERIFFIRPYASMFDQNTETIRNILEPTKENHNNTSEQCNQREKFPTQDWNSPVIFTPIEEILDVLFGAGMHNVRRMHLLANAVLIFDDIQSLPTNHIHLFCNAINFLVEQCGSTVVLCGATQSLLNSVDKNKGALKFTNDHNIIPDGWNLLGSSNNADVLDCRQPGGWPDKKVLEFALNKIEQNGSCLVIVNTEEAVQTLRQQCQEVEKVHVFYLDNSMSSTHCKETLTQIQETLNNKLPLLCISTSLIESGTNLDFSTVIRYMAGLNSIARAATCCNRNGEQRDSIGNLKMGHVYVINPATEDLSLLLEIQCGIQITNRIFDDVKAGIEDFGGNLITSKAVEKYFLYYFLTQKGIMDYPVSVQEAGCEDTLLNLLSLNVFSVEEYGRINAVAPDLYLSQPFKTAAEIFTERAHPPNQKTDISCDRTGQFK